MSDNVFNFLVFVLCLMIVACWIFFSNYSKVENDRYNSHCANHMDDPICQFVWENK